MSRFILRGYSTVQNPEEFYKFRVYLKHAKTKVKMSKHSSSDTKPTELIPLRAIPPEARSAKGKKPSGIEHLSAIEGWRLDLVKSYVDTILSEFKPEKEYLQTTIDGEVHDDNEKFDEWMITQDYGIRLAVLFKVIARIQIKEKIIKILDAVQSMEMDELFYWWKKLFEVEDDTKIVTSFRVMFED
jgi:hypothetical protein